MSTIEPDDLETTGYFLPKDSQLRLKKLREYVEFLANLARPRMADEAKEMFAEIRPGEVAICLELLEEQIAQVLDELSWPAELGEKEGRFQSRRATRGFNVWFQDPPQPVVGARCTPEAVFGSHVVCAAAC